MLVSLAKTAFFVLLYYASQLFMSLVVQIIYIASRGGDVSEKELASFISAGSIELVLASNAILIMVVALISRVKNKTLSQSCDIKPIKSGYVPVIVMGIFAQFSISVILTFMMSYGLFPTKWIVSYENAPMMTTNASLIIRILSMGIFAPLAEEIVFRGCIQKSLNESMPRWASIIITALIFAVMHGYEIQVIYAFIFGVLISWIYARYNSILPTIFFHIAFNMTSVLMPNISVYAMVMLGLGGIYIIIRGIRTVHRTTMHDIKNNDNNNDKNDGEV